jgi:Fe-S cluster assembly scaffold protein SufB
MTGTTAADAPRPARAAPASSHHGWNRHGVQVRLLVDPGTKTERPVHLCFGVIPAEGLQEIIAEYEIGEGADVQFLAHCSFPNAVNVQHRMEASIHVGKQASLTYTEEQISPPASVNT